MSKQTEFHFRLALTISALFFSFKLAEHGINNHNIFMTCTGLLLCIPSMLIMLRKEQIKDLYKNAFSFEKFFIIEKIKELFKK